MTPEQTAWQLTQDYLRDIAKATKRKDLRLFRHVNVAPGHLLPVWELQEITAENAWGHLRPSYFGGPNTGETLDFYTVRVLGDTESDDLDGESPRIITWRLGQLPGCCAFALSTGAFVAGGYRNMGLQTRSIKFREDIARLHGYTAVLCTDITANTNQRKALARAKWQDLFTTVNRRTSREVNISIKQLRD